ncbi:MAG: hypothetical protein R2867_32635 [Caldilineaceae bacterium]
MALALVDQVLADAMTAYAIGDARDPLLDGVRLWQLWDLPLPLADHHKSLVPWVYQTLPQSAPGVPLALPINYAELCAIHTLWMAHPAQLRIPLLCSDFDTTPGRLSPQLLQRPPVQLPWLNVPYFLDHALDGQGQPQSVIHPGEAIALATVIGYIDAHYGRDQLPVLLANIQRYDSWDALIPAQFGLAVEEFEAAWQMYIAQTFLVPTG